MAARSFVVNVAAIRRHPGVRRAEQRRGRIDGLAVTGSVVAPQAEVEIDAVLEVVSGGIVVAGTITVPWVGECRRCLGEVTGDLTVEVREIYEPRAGGHLGDNPLEQEEETYPLLGDQLDLQPLARDAVLLNLPQVPLCRDDCAGLCPVCGGDRNLTACGCSESVSDPRRAMLDALRGPDPS